MRFSVGTGLLRSLAVLGCVGVAACATPLVGPRTTVILLPDEDGSVGAVVVSTTAGSQGLNQAYRSATADSAAAPPSAPVDLGRERVDAAYAALLQAQPSKPASFVLRFLLDKTELTEESKASVPALLDAARARKPTEILIFGHADASGSEERNFRLSAERAKVVADLLRKHDPSLGTIDIQAFGDSAPLVPSKSRSADPRNRRAEVLIL